MRVAPLPQVHHWYWISMLKLIDSCQNKVSTDQYHVTMSRAQVKRSQGFFKVTANQVLPFRLDRGLKPGYYSGGEWGRTCKGKISEQIKLWRVVDFSSDIFLAQSSPKSLQSPWYIAYVISTILVTPTRYGLLKCNWKKIVKPHA